jgi:hypothetical protein
MVRLIAWLPRGAESLPRKRLYESGPPLAGAKAGA